MKWYKERVLLQPATAVRDGGCTPLLTFLNIYCSSIIDMIISFFFTTFFFYLGSLCTTFGIAASWQYPLWLWQPIGVRAHEKWELPHSAGNSHYFVHSIGKHFIASGPLCWSKEQTLGIYTKKQKISEMRPTFPRFNAAKPTGGFSIPPELYPLYAACFVVCCSATYFSYKKLTTDKTLKLGRSVPTFDEKLSEALDKKDE